LLTLRSGARRFIYAIALLIDRVELKESGLKLSLVLPLPQSGISKTLKLEHLIPVRMKKRGVELKLIIGNERARAASVDLVLLKTIARAHRWLDWLVAGEVKSLNEIATREEVTRSFVGRIIRLAFLAPEIVEVIAAGKQPPELSAELLTKHLHLPFDWDDQKHLLNIG
jgi:site-specific DNA recombinase